MLKYIHNVTKVMCALYVRCALSVLQKECRKVWGARYTLGACYRSENTVQIKLLDLDSFNNEEEHRFYLHVSNIYFNSLL